MSVADTFVVITTAGNLSYAGVLFFGAFRIRHLLKPVMQMQAEMQKPQSDSGIKVDDTRQSVPIKTSQVTTSV